MRQRIENNILITVEGADLTQLTDLRVFVKQDTLFFEYVPAVKSASEMIVTVPLQDAVKLYSAPAKIQMAFVDESGNPGASGIVSVSVKELLKEDGYDPS